MFVALGSAKAAEGKKADYAGPAVSGLGGVGSNVINFLSIVFFFLTKFRTEIMIVSSKCDLKIVFPTNKQVR